MRRLFRKYKQISDNYKLMSKVRYPMSEITSITFLLQKLEYLFQILTSNRPVHLLRRSLKGLERASYNTIIMKCWSSYYIKGFIKIYLSPRELSSFELNLSISYVDVV